MTTRDTDHLPVRALQKDEQRRSGGSGADSRRVWEGEGKSEPGLRPREEFIGRLWMISDGRGGRGASCRTSVDLPGTPITAAHTPSEAPVDAHHQQRGC